MQVRAASLELPGGEVETRGGELLVRLADRRRSAEAFGQIIIRSTAEGAQVHLADIATIPDGDADNDRRTLYNGEPAVQLSVFRVGSETPQGVADTVREVSDQFTLGLPEKISVDYWNDQSALLEGRIDLLVRNGRLGLILVVGILALFLNARLAFGPRWASPSPAFLLMPGLDMTVMILFSLIVTLGMVVDDAIIVGEAAYSRMEEGEDKMTAAITGAQRCDSGDLRYPHHHRGLWTDVLRSWLHGQAVSDHAGHDCERADLLTHRVVLHPPRSPRPHQDEERRQGLPGQDRASTRGASDLHERTPRSLHPGTLQDHAREDRSKSLHSTGERDCHAALRHRTGRRRLPAHELHAEHRRGIVSANARLPYGAPTENTEAVREVLEASLATTLAELGTDTIQGVYTTVGAPAKVEGPGPIDAREGSHHLGIQVYLVPTDSREFGTKDFLRAWESNTPIPGVEALRFKDDWGPSAGAAIDLRLSHPDTAVLTRAADDVLERLRSYSDLTQIESSLAEGKPRLDYTLKDAATTLGITSRDVGMQLRHAFFGAEALRGR